MERSQPSLKKLIGGSILFITLPLIYSLILSQIEDSINQACPLTLNENGQVIGFNWSRFGYKFLAIGIVILLSLIALILVNESGLFSFLLQKEQDIIINETENDTLNLYVNNNNNSDQEQTESENSANETLKTLSIHPIQDHSYKHKAHSPKSSSKKKQRR